MKTSETLEKIMEIILFHKESTEEHHLKAIKLIEIGKQLYQLGECPNAVSEILATAIIYARHCSYREELNEPIMHLVKANLFRGVEDIMKEAEL